MGAWVDDRLAEEEEVVVVLTNQEEKTKYQSKQEGQLKRTYRILEGRICDGCNWTGTGQLRPTDIIINNIIVVVVIVIVFSYYVAFASALLLLPLRRQFSRQLYEWPCLPLFKSRTKLNRYY